MRVSSDKTDPGYEEWQISLMRGERTKVLLDGAEVKECETADDQEGFVKRCKLDDAGQIFAVGDEIVTEIVSGKVEIIFEKTA